jgi:hypothetical protein
MKKIKIVYGVLFGLMVQSAVHAQIDTVRKHLEKINAIYDSAQGLAFDVRFDSASDTVYSSFQRKETGGTIVLNGKKFCIQQELTESMQNDSFNVVVMEQEHILIVTKARNKTGIDFFPFRQRIDTLLLNNFFGFTYSLQKTDSINVLQFQTSDTMVRYKRFRFEYDAQFFYLKKLEVETNYLPQENYTSLTPLPERKKVRQLVTRVYFSNYRPAEMDFDYFKNSRYFELDGLGRPIPVEKYKNFEVYSDLPKKKVQ